MTIHEALKVSIGHGLTDAQIDKLAAVCRLKKCAVNEDIILQQSTDCDPFIVLLGNVRVSYYGKEIRKGKEGSLFGEIALIDNFPRSANVQAVDACEVAFLPQAALEELFKVDPSIAAVAYKNIARAMCSKMRQSTNWSEGLMAK